MQRNLTLRLLPSEAANDQSVREHIARELDTAPTLVTGYQVHKRSIDARGRQPRILLNLTAFIGEPFAPVPRLSFHFGDVRKSTRQVIVVGAGPAGLFAALRLIRAGIRPILLERGKDVRARRRDLAILNREGRVNPDSNYCFGEGGAGTYSDGKLYTRSTKRGDVTAILNLFVHFGADESILYDAHPHIGTNKLPGIISAMRQQILDSGGEYLFEKKVVDLLIHDNTFRGVVTADGDRLHGAACILATGHSARDIFQLLHAKGILIETKSFALGVRVEHPQHLIDSVQYHCSVRDPFLPPASYSLVQQVAGKGVFSFCMCPGGIIAPAATSPGELVVNGWSPSKRNNPFANSGMVVSVDPRETEAFKQHGPLAGMYFQQAVEQAAFKAGGGKFMAPAQRLIDFTGNTLSATLPDCSYLPGIRPALLGEVLPPFIHRSLQEAFVHFGKKMKGYLTNEAVVVATESRTSSPVRIPRNPDTLQHPQIKNLYPCGEGAGYAGGIVSAAMDGERIADILDQSVPR